MKSFKILVGYPPLKLEKGKRATLGQNRQYQEFSNPISILPIVPASAATLLKSKNYNVIWKDSIAEDLTFEQFFDYLKKESPDLFLFETKTPVIKQHWQTINKLKELFPKLKIAICGDHVTYLPEETLNNSKVDYVLTGGDYDFLLLSLVEHLTKKKKLEPGIYYKEKGKINSSGKFKLSHNLDDLPFIDRELIPFRLYQTEYNIKVKPFAYIMSARDCWWGNCTFCLDPSTNILTNKGSMAIKEVVEGNDLRNLSTLTHNGTFKQITRSFRRFYNGQLLNLELNSLKQNIKLTPEHEIFALKRSSIKRCSKKGSWNYLCIPDRISKRVKCNGCDKQYYNNYKIKKIRSSNLEKGDFVAVPIIKKIKNQKYLDVKKFLEIKPNLIKTTKLKSDKLVNKIINEHRKGNSQRNISKLLRVDRETIKRYIDLYNKNELDLYEGKVIENNGHIKYKGSKRLIPRKILLSNEFLRLIGYYLAEGHTTKIKDRPNSYVLGLTFSCKEEDYINDVLKITRKLFSKVNTCKYLNKSNNTTQITINNSILAVLFKRLFGENCYNKKIPKEFIYLPLNKQKELLRGLFRGDGHIRIRNKGMGGSEYVYETVSSILAQQVTSILFRCKAIPKVRVLQPRGKGTVQKYSISLCQYDIENIFPEIKLPPRTKKYRSGFILNNSIFIPIKNIYKEVYKGPVFNIEVEEDHSYTANNIAVGNCAWPQLYTKFRTRSVKNVLDEIEILIQKYNIKEIFDDSGTLPKGIWLKELCNGLIKRGYNKKITYSCNMRFNALTQEEFNLMKEANFRLLKFGLESANQITLDTLNKGIKVQDIIDGCRMAKKAGLTVHLTMIIGYPWETKKEALNTLNLAKRLMQSGLADVLQSTVLIPYPGTKLWLDAKKENLFNFNPESYERYNMKEPVLKTVDMSPQEIMEICNSTYKIFITPKYILTHLKRIKSLIDIKYTLKGVKAVIGHRKDFSK